MEKSVDKDYQGIRGWLILVVIGLVITPINIGISLYQTHLPIFSDGTWQVLTSPSSESYHSLWAPLLAFEIIGNLGVIALALATLYFITQKSRHVPAIAIFYFLASFAFVLIDVAFTQMIPAISSQPTDPETIKEVTRSFIGTVIWVPYFFFSKRVKATFTQ
ncbi:MAG: DUF2569 domain-containing protein [Moraxellaceae bacterium]|nr:DUF2569 domain-containing protein [Moraxellaceae bacterium]